MRKYMIVILTIVAMTGILNMSSCKRNSSVDPDPIGPTGHSITLSGMANPLTLYIPKTEPEVMSQVTVIATKYDGTPANNKDIVMESGSYGFFPGRNITYKLTTNANGVVSTPYYIPKGADVRINTTIYLTATLIDEQLPADTHIYCHVPINLIPYTDDDYIKISGQVIDQFSSKGVANVVVELSTGGVTKTGKNGSYSIVVYGGTSQGWYGEITPTKEGVSFIPGSISIGSQDFPVYSDIPGQNFYAVIKQTIQASQTEINVDNTPREIGIYLYCTPDATFRANFIASSSASWINLATTNGGTEYQSITGTTPMNIYVSIGTYIGGTTDRTGNVTITAISPENAVSTVTINITQAF